MSRKLYEVDSPITHPSAPSSVSAYVSVANAARRTENMADEAAGDAASPAEQAVAEPVVSPYFQTKHRFDWWITLSLCALALPVILITAIVVLILNGRPIFYRQVRVGKNGREFQIWKFRTMVPNAEQHTGAVWSHQSDPRVTRLGRWLRCCHIDELPQFFNVLSGDMNLIGPRPERPEFVRELARELPDYIHRIDVRPGITGLAQLRLGYDQRISEVRKKVKLDLRYIQTASLRLDLSLVFWTIPYVIRQFSQRFTSSVRSRFRGSGLVDETPASSNDSAEQHPPAPHFEAPSRDSKSGTSKSGTSNRRSAC